MTCRNPENMLSEILAIRVSGHIGNYAFPKYWQLEFPEKIAIIFLEMLATYVNNNLCFENVDEG